MEVRLAKKRGFCFGVEDAIELAERTVEGKQDGQVVALGPVIHNRQVVERLEDSGLNQSADIGTAAVATPADTTAPHIVVHQIVQYIDVKRVVCVETTVFRIDIVDFIKLKRGVGGIGRITDTVTVHFTDDSGIKDVVVFHHAVIAAE